MCFASTKRVMERWSWIADPAAFRDRADEQVPMSQTPPAVQESQRDADSDGNLVTFLDAALWEQLSRSSGLEELALAWLTLLCRAIDGAQQGLLLLETKEANVFEPVAAW